MTQQQANDRAYTVLKIDEHRQITEGGGVSKFYRIRYQTRGGTVLSEDIPESQFNTKQTKVILAAKATEADKILSE